MRNRSWHMMIILLIELDPFIQQATQAFDLLDRNFVLTPKPEIFSNSDIKEK